MIYQFLKRPQESDNPLLKFTKYQRGVMYEMYRQFSQGEVIGKYNANYGLRCLYDGNQTAVSQQKIPNQEEKHYLTFTFDGAPFAEIKFSVDGADIILLKWFDFVEENMSPDGGYEPSDDNLPNYDVLTDEERDFYQRFRLTNYKGIICGELYNGKYFLYNSMNQSERRQIFLGKDDKNKTFICFDTECKKPIIYVSLLKDAANQQGQKTTLLKVLQYVDPTFNSAPKNLVPIN